MIISHQNSPKVINRVNKLQTQIYISRGASILQNTFLKDMMDKSIVLRV